MLRIITHGMLCLFTLSGTMVTAMAGQSRAGTTESGISSSNQARPSLASRLVNFGRPSGSAGLGTTTAGDSKRQVLREIKAFNTEYDEMKQQVQPSNILLTTTLSLSMPFSKPKYCDAVPLLQERAHSLLTRLNALNNIQRLREQIHDLKDKEEWLVIYDKTCKQVVARAKRQVLLEIKRFDIEYDKIRDQAHFSNVLIAHMSSMSIPFRKPEHCDELPPMRERALYLLARLKDQDQDQDRDQHLQEEIHDMESKERWLKIFDQTCQHIANAAARQTPRVNDHIKAVHRP